MTLLHNDVLRGKNHASSSGGNSALAVTGGIGAKDGATKDREVDTLGPSQGM